MIYLFLYFCKIPFNFPLWNVDLSFLFHGHNFPGFDQAIELPAADPNCFHEFKGGDIRAVKNTPVFIVFVKIV